MPDDIELSPTDWVREQTEKILNQGTTDGVEILDRPVVLFTVTGAKTGAQRYVPLMRVEKDGRYAMVASKGGAPAHPSWYHNVKANPTVAVQDGDKVVTLTARELEGPDARSGGGGRSKRIRHTRSTRRRHHGRFRFSFWNSGHRSVSATTHG